MHAPVRSLRPAAVKQAGRVLQTAACVVAVVVLVGAPLLWGGWHPLAAVMTGIVAGVATLLWVVGVGLRGRWARAVQIVDVGPARFAVQPENQWAGGVPCAREKGGAGGGARGRSIAVVSVRRVRG